MVIEHFVLGPRWHRGLHPLFKKFLTGFRPFQKPTFVSGWGTRLPSPPPPVATPLVLGDVSLIISLLLFYYFIDFMYFSLIYILKVLLCIRISLIAV